MAFRSPFPLSLAALAPLAFLACGAPSGRNMAAYVAVRMEVAPPYDVVGVNVVNATSVNLPLDSRETYEKQVMDMLSERGYRPTRLPARPVADVKAWTPAAELSPAAAALLARRMQARALLEVDVLEVRQEKIEGLSSGAAVYARLIDEETGRVLWAQHASDWASQNRLVTFKPVDNAVARVLAAFPPR